MLTLAGYDPTQALRAVYDNGHREQLTLAEVGAIARVQYGGSAPRIAGERSGQTTDAHRRRRTGAPCASAATE